MTMIDVRPDLDLAPLAEVRAAHDAGLLLHGAITHIGILPNGTTGARASVAILVNTTDGKTVLGETTLDLFATAARGLLAAPIAVAEGHEAPAAVLGAIVIDWESDDRVSIQHNGEVLETLDYDNHGAAGMTAGVAIARKIAEVYGLSIEVRGEAGR